MDQPDPATPVAEPRADSSPRASWLRLLVVIGALLAAAALVVWQSRSAPPVAKRAFDSRPLQRVRKLRPNFVVIGNSMAGTRMHERTLNQLLAPRRAMTITYGGSRAAVWYLILKNYVLASGVKPDRVLIFFRYQELTELTYRESGLDQQQIENTSPELDPVVSAKLFPAPKHPVKHLAWQLSKFAPVSRLRLMAGDYTQPWFDSMSTLFVEEPDAKQRHRLINAPFALEHLRGAAAASAAAGEAIGDFASSVDTSFLPEILSLAKDGGVPLAFVRIRPRAVAEGHPESPAMRRYVAELKQYIEARGAMFVDLSDASWESADLYRNGDHIGPQFLAHYTRLFVANLPALFAEAAR
ncbi:MAG: hypothetical protein ACOY0T_16635 [Myxococcota bacterium]